jgi:arsenate reductase (thioredoxin)
MTQKKVLVLCTGNSARSQMAQEIINALRGDAWHAVSAGTQPAKQVNPYAIRALSEIGIATQDTTPTHLDQYRGQPFDVVITVCDDAADNCPVWLGQGKRVHIWFPDPAAAKGTDKEILNAFREVRDDIQTRILGYLDNFLEQQQEHGERKR